MPDNPPISTEVPETVTVDTGADKESVQSLNQAFSDFWTEQDTGSSEPPPEAPSGQGAAQETKTELVRPELPKEAEIPQAQALPQKEISDEELEKMELPPNARPDHVSQFRNLRMMVMEERRKSKAEAERAAKLEQELSQARQNTWTDEQRQDYEHAAGVRRRVDFVTDPEFQQRFQAPVFNEYQRLLNEAIEALPEKDKAVAWGQHIFQNYRPEQLSRTWWLNSVVSKVPSEMERQSLMNGVNRLMQLQRDRDQEIATRTSDKNSFDSWINERSENTRKRVSEEIMAEIGVQEQRIKEVLPRNLDDAKTPEERRAIERHNERFTKLNEFFKNTVHDISANGPKAWVRAAIEATRSQIMNEQITALEEDLKSTKAERDKLRAEVEKIHGVRRKLAATTGTPPASSSKPNNNLSIKNVGDVRQQFDNYWQEIDRQ
jgi:hypothetical protein